MLQNECWQYSRCTPTICLDDTKVANDELTHKWLMATMADNFQLHCSGWKDGYTSSEQQVHAAYIDCADWAIINDIRYSCVLPWCQWRLG